MPKGQIKIWIVIMLVCCVAQIVMVSWPTIGEFIENGKVEKPIERPEQISPGESNPGTQDNEAVDDTTSILSSTIQAIMTIMMFVGSASMIFGAMNFLLGFMQEDCDRRSSAISFLVVGGVMMAFKPIVMAILGQ